MSANPRLTQVPGAGLLPLPYDQEALTLKRECLDLSLDGLQTRSGKWTARGSLFLSNLRLVFVADQEEPGSGAPWACAHRHSCAGQQAG